MAYAICHGTFKPKVLECIIILTLKPYSKKMIGNIQVIKHLHMIIKFLVNKKSESRK